MKDQRKLASVLIYVGSALCFFFPFVTVSCGGMSAITLSGRQLALGTTIKQAQPFGSPQAQAIHASPSATVALFCALAGIVLSLIGRRLAVASAASGAGGAIGLIILQSRLHEQIEEHSGGVARVHLEAGFYLAMILLVTGAAWNLYVWIQDRGIRNPNFTEDLPGVGLQGNGHAVGIDPAASDQAKTVPPT